MLKQNSRDLGLFSIHIRAFQKNAQICTIFHPSCWCDNVKWPAMRPCSPARFWCVIPIRDLQVTHLAEISGPKISMHPDLDLAYPTCMLLFTKRRRACTWNILLMGMFCSKDGYHHNYILASHENLSQHFKHRYHHNLTLQNRSQIYSSILL